MKYYLIGSVHAGNTKNPKDVYNLCIERDLISCGYCGDENLKKHLGKPQERIKKILMRDGYDDYPADQVSKFLSIKDGDIIAIKRKWTNSSKSSPKNSRRKAFTEIGGYAIAKTKAGVLYDFDKDALKHVINVEYLESEISIMFEMGYRQTIFEISEEERIRKIFRNYADIPVFQREMESERKKRIAVEGKSTDRKLVDYSTRYWLNKIHNKLQMKYYNYLVKIYGENCVFLEEDYVDIKLVENNVITFFEIKSNQSPKKCIREGIGQLLDYYSKSEDENIRLRIVGQNKLDKEAKIYLKTICDNLSLDFGYKALDNINLS